jgi:uncharacterized protein DUF1549/uncharacterized protein DUF1553
MRNRVLLVVFALIAGVGGIFADDAKSDQPSNSKRGKLAKPSATGDADSKKIPASKSDALALSRLIDQEIDKRLAAEKLTASPRCDDAEFVRRIYLDLTGVVPSAAKAAEFIDAADSSKRSKLIDELLASPAFGRHLADVWDKLLFHRLTDNKAVKIDPLTKWLEEKFNSDARWDVLVRDLLTATGSQEDNGAATYFLGTLTADKMVDSASRLFMGVKLECAQCHNHPFTGWKQNDYWGMAAFFMKVRVQGNTKNAKKGGTPEIVESGRGRQKNFPDSAKELPPKFFQGDQPNIHGAEALRPLLAKWLTSPENKFFSRAFANRVWGQLFGAGIVNPIDDMHDDRVPSHPELLAELSKQFAASGFDIKFLYRAICGSDSYQRTSKPTNGNDSDGVLFSHMNIKAFTPEQLYDSLVAVLGEPQALRGGGKKAGNAKGGPLTSREQFSAFFGVGEDNNATDYEEGIPQALRLMNNPFTARNCAPVARQLTQGLTGQKALDKLYLTALARRPTAEETEKLTAYIGKADSASSAHGDILWALLNSSEFTLNH